MTRQSAADLPKVEICSASEWRTWLEENHTSRQSIWLVTYKKAQLDKYTSYGEIVDQALCFGWIDSLPRKLDAERTMLLLSPRKPGSAWSAANKKRVARLTRAGLMHPAGETAVEEARRSGAWDFLNDVDALIVPSDLAAALDSAPLARSNFDAFSKSSRRGILEWIKQAKRKETREKRIAETVGKAALGIKANH